MAQGRQSPSAGCPSGCQGMKGAGEGVGTQWGRRGCRNRNWDWRNDGETSCKRRRVCQAQSIPRCRLGLIKTQLVPAAKHKCKHPWVHSAPWQYRGSAPCEAGQ